MSTQAGKDVIYIDIDDEITTLIDHVRSAKQRIVALVLPKRAAVLQSIVNMKLLKRTADDAKKHLVLITTEAGLLPLAGAVGVYVAKSLQSKPEIPHTPKAGLQNPEDSEDAVNMADEGDTDAEVADLDASRPVGDLMSAGMAGAGNLDDDEDDIIELDNTVADGSASAKDGKKKSKEPKSKKDKKLAIPDFNKFRLWAILGGVGLVALGALLFVALVVMPKATVLVKTDSSAITTSVDVTLDTKLEKLTVSGKRLPAIQQQTDKTTTQQANATGQKDKGAKASGQLKLINCSAGDSVTIPAGTGVISNGLTYITQEKAVMPVGSKSCIDISGSTSDTIMVLAQSGGDKYNIDTGAKFTVPGYANVSGKGGVISGGTSEIVQVLTQADIDSAKQKLIAQDTTATKTELKQKLKDQGLFAVEDTFAAGNPQITASAAVGDEVTGVTVTQKATYGMLGVHEADLKQFITNEVNKQIDPTKQTILDYGLTTATFKLENQSDGAALVTMGDTAVAGSDLNINDIKKQVAGKKANEAEDMINKFPGVTSVKVTYAPFWVSAIPSNTSKITITVEKPPVKNVQ